MTQPPATILRDTFTGADGTLLENHAPDVGGAWTKVFGANSTIQSNALRPDASPFPSFYVNAALPSRDYEISFTLVSSPGSVAAGFLAHRQPASIDLYWAIHTGGQYQIAKLIGGVTTVLVSLVEALPPLPATFTLRVRKGDDLLRFLVNSVEKVATNDATLSGGQGGLYGRSSGAFSIIDDFSAQMVPADVHLTAHYAPTIRLAAEPPRVPTLAASFEKTITKGAAQ